MLVLLLHRSSSSSSDSADADDFPPAASSTSILVYGAYLAVLALLVLLFVLVILCRKRRDDATPASSLIPTLDLHSSKLWIGPTNPTSPFPFPPSPPPYSQPSPQQLQLISRHNHLLLLLASNFCRSLPWECGLVQGLADIGHRSRRYYAEISDAKVDAEVGGEQAVQCMMCVVDVSGLDVVDYSVKRFMQMRTLLLSLQHPNVLPVYNAHWLPAAPSSSSSPTSFSSPAVAVTAPSASPHCIFVTPLSPHGSLRDHLTSALYSHPYATKYFTAASQHRRGTPLPLRHVRAFTRQLISGLLYLRSRGIVMYHLHSGNVLLMREDGGRGVRCLLAGVEGVLLGLKGRLHRKVKRLRHVDPVLSSLALLVYEMCTGVEAEVRETVGGGAEGEAGGVQEQGELMRIGNRDYADADDFIALILHAAHTVTLEELLSHRLCSQQSSASPALPPQPSPPSASSSDAKLARKLLLPVHRHYVLEVYRRLPHTVADGLWYAREGGWGETAGDDLEGRERESGGKKKKKDRDREQHRDRSRHDRALIV